MPSATQRRREQSRRTGGAETAAAISASASAVSNSLVLQTDNGSPVWYVGDVRYPPEVARGGVADIEVEMVNERVFITPLNPDQCVDGIENGLEADVTVNPTWTDSKTVTDCLAVGGFTPSTRTRAFDFEMPSAPGTYSFDVTVEATGTGNGGAETYQIVVPSDDDSGTGSRPGAGNGGADGGNDNGNDDDGLSDATLLALGGAAFALVALILS